MNPILRFRVRSAVPGLADNDSAAPPTTMVKDDPGPVERVRESVVAKGRHFC